MVGNRRGAHAARGNAVEGFRIASAASFVVASVLAASMLRVAGFVPVMANAADEPVAAQTSVQQDQRMGAARETTEGQRAKLVVESARERAERETGTTLTDEEVPDCLHDGMSIHDAAACEKRIAQAVRDKHNREEAAKRAEEQRVAEEAARVKAEQEAAARKAAEEQAAREKEAEAARQAQAQRQAAAQQAQAQAAPAPAQNQAQAAPAPAPAPSGPVDHGIARTCNGNQPADCQWAIDQGGLVQVNFPDPWGMGTWIDFAVHNNEGGAWMLDVNVGDVIRIGGVDYRVKNRRTVVSGGTAVVTPIMMQTCDWTGGTMQVFDLERA
ncbi:hypothetical protein [Bifidobacterium vansinderenii]|uniref:Translation initiation factor IF-2 n=1 Tax=Bifidobacterium vansinderenii TaxID=1984871 RepID=A0A229VYG3_9BIFI|nr:hypothetical protein [Bifidobacterium vansinderenii]OXN00440.1 translation initiation factor IF-2 [Bifidobacterium vansinderenii]